MKITCFERFNRIILGMRTVAFICGADFARKGFKPNFHTWFTIAAINAFLAFSFYNIYDGLVVQGDWKIMLQSFSMVGSCLQGYSKLLCAIFGREVVLSLLKKLNDIYRECQKDPEYLPVLTHHLDMTTKMLKGVMAIYIATVVIVISYPLVYGSIKGEKLLILQFVVPGVDPETKNGYLLNIAFHSMLSVLGGFGNFAGDVFLFLTITHISLVKDIFRVKCVKLNRLIEKKKGQKKTMPMLLNVLQWHQHYNTYVNQTEAIYSLVVFVQISTSVMSICCTLFCIVTKSWPAAFAYLIYSYIILLAYCGLGNIVEKSNDEIIEIVYGTILWYELSVVEQKLVLLMLRKSQMPTKLTVALIVPLSMETALQLTKAIYSYMMMLVNFLQNDES